MIPEPSILIALVQLVDRWPLPLAPRRRGRPAVYSDRLFLKALVIMIVKHPARVHTWLTVLEQPTLEMHHLCVLLTEHGRYPPRRTWERRRRALPDTLPAQIGCLGRYRVAVLTPWPVGSPLAAIDSTALRACGGVWHQKPREAGGVPHTSIDSEAHWTKSGWHGWVYGWQLHLVGTVAAVWIPLAADLTPANAVDNEVAPRLLPELPPLLQRPVQSDLRHARAGPHARAPGHPPLCLGSRARLPVDASLSLPTRRRSARRAQALSQGRLMIYGRVSSSYGIT
jgi:hypothetical protein